MVRIPNTLAQLDGGSVVLRVVKRASVIGPQRFSKEFNATGTQRLTQTYENCVDSEADFVGK